MKVITFFNNKGGVGKTTTIVNIGGYLSLKKNKKILLVDLDPQSNATQAIMPMDSWQEFYCINGKSTKATISNCFEKIRDGDADLQRIDIPCEAKDNAFNLDLIPGHPSLSLIEEVMSQAWSETIGCQRGGLRKVNWLNSLKDFYPDYDYILIDVDPSLGALNRSALLNTDYFITPMASDIFSLLGVSNISQWLDLWMRVYEQAIKNFRISESNAPSDLEKFFKKFKINVDTSKTTRFIGYSIQQYAKRTFKSGERPTSAYEAIIKNFHSIVPDRLKNFIKEGVENDDLKLGDIPYVYSVVPLSQTSSRPIFELSYSDGLRGGQSLSVEKYSQYLNLIVENLIKNAEA